MRRVEALPLWKVLESKGTDEQRTLVRELVEYAAAMLDRVIETFPTYTLHNHVHAENVVDRMADLLGADLEKLTALEAAMLILSAYYHDIGMVFDEEDRTKLTQESHWEEFLRTDSEAFLAVQEDGGVPRDVAEQYCRWRHAERVFVHLEQLSADKLKWGTTSLYEPLGYLCLSHSQDVREIQNSDVLKTDFRRDADLKFCAVLLRLADLLDFDGSRTPEAVYGHLGLGKRHEPLEATSDIEWHKHLCSEGFRFPEDGDRRTPYDLALIAGPTEPAVHHDVLEFLDQIDGELRQSDTLLRACSTKWQGLVLPDRILRDHIEPNGYRYGEYRFVLEQRQVLDLLMGENLYENPYTFVRELVQNALDTSRHREYVERARGETAFRAKPICVTEWRDRDGYQWVRFDDDGVGMDEDIIREHFLRVGSSYYGTPRFEADLLRAQRKGAGDFLPISRFGIGILSCFVAGDRVEVNTRRQTPDGSTCEPVRLSLQGVHGFYTLQTPRLPPSPMPGADGDEDGYRAEFGTSIAVRLNPKKEQAPLDLKKQLERYVLCPPVPVEYRGERIGGDPAELVDKPWCERMSFPLTREEMAPIERCLGYHFAEPLEIEFLPIDLTKYSPAPQLFRGQIVIARIRPAPEPDALWRFLRGSLERFRVDVSPDPRGLRVSLGLRFHPSRLGVGTSTSAPDVARRPASFTDMLARLRSVDHHDDHFRVDRDGNAFGVLEVPLDLIHLNVPPDLRRRIPVREDDCSRWLSHNGVVVPVGTGPCAMDIISLERRMTLRVIPSGASWGVIALADSLRPDVSVSREMLRSMPWGGYSCAGIALLRALAALGVDVRGVAGDEGDANPPDVFSDLVGRQRLLLRDALEDDLVTPGGPWADLPIIMTTRGLRSLNEIRAAVAAGEQVELRDYIGREKFLDEDADAPFAPYCAATLVRVALKVVFQPKSRLFLALPGDPPPIREGEKLFPALAFVPFERSDVFATPYGVLNRDHPFAQWLIDAAPAMVERCPGILGRVKNALFGVSQDSEGFPQYVEHEQAGVALNQVLDRLREYGGELRPPDGLRLTKADFEW